MCLSHRWEGLPLSVSVELETVLTFHGLNGVIRTCTHSSTEANDTMRCTRSVYTRLVGGKKWERIGQTAGADTVAIFGHFSKANLVFPR